MTPEPTAHPAVALLENTREDLYRVADRAPLLSPRLTAATLAITEILTHLGDPTTTSEDLHEQLLAASNSVASARYEPSADQEIRLQLAGASVALTRARKLFGSAPSGRSRRHLRLVHSA